MRESAKIQLFIIIGSISLLLLSFIYSCSIKREYVTGGYSYSANIYKVTLSESKFTIPVETEVIRKVERRSCNKSIGGIVYDILQEYNADYFLIMKEIREGKCITLHGFILRIRGIQLKR